MRLPSAKPARRKKHSSRPRIYRALAPGAFATLISLIFLLLTVTARAADKTLSPGDPITARPALYAQAGYIYNLRAPGNETENKYRLEGSSGGASLDAVCLMLAKPSGSGLPGFALNLAAGSIPRDMNRQGKGVNGRVENDDPVDLLEARFFYDLPFAGGLKLGWGRAPADLGAETLLTGLSPLYSHSFAYLLSEPMTLTGFAAELAFAGPFKAGLGLTNGLDAPIDGGDYRTGRLYFQYAPNERTRAGLNLLAGPADGPGESGKRYLAVLSLSSDVTEAISFAVGGDVGLYDLDGTGKTLPGGENRGAWWGLTLTGTWRIADILSVSARGDYFADEEGTRTETHQRMHEMTFGAKARVTEGFFVMPEFRHDWSTKRIFSDANGQPNRKGQNTFSVGAVWNWP